MTQTDGLDRLHQVAAALRNGEPSPTLTVREFLSWFNAQRRGWWIVYQIRRRLDEAGLLTVPDFELVWIDARIKFDLVEVAEASGERAEPSASTEVAAPEAAGDEIAGSVWVSKEATYRIARLDAANQEVVSANPQESLKSVITKLMAYGFSQLPVMQNERDVRGLVSWQSIGSRLALGVDASTAADVSEQHHEISADRSIFDAIPVILKNDYVLVRDGSNRISGIITAADLSLQFKELTEPFLLLSEIENLLRNLIGDRFTAKELADAQDPGDKGKRAIGNIADLSFGEYVRLLQKPERWNKLAIEVDRTMFCEKLDIVRVIRNEVMHFDPEGIAESELSELREFTRFLQQLMTVLGRKL